MKISVALCTYNGGRYLPQQLESIRRQSRAVSELVACDDGSTDNTIALLEAFAREVDFPVWIHRNEQNLGSTRNFEKCLLRCTGDVIFCSDQDDVWFTEKVEKQLAFFEQHPALAAVFTDADIIDGNSLPTGGTLWQKIEFDAAARHRWNSGQAPEILFNGYVVTGATLALRQSAIATLVPFPTHVPLLIHDGWMALVLALRGEIGFVPESLMQYRIHASQQVGISSGAKPVTLHDRRSRSRQEKLRPLQAKAERLEQLHALLLERLPEKAALLRGLRARQQHFGFRAALPEGRLRRIGPVLRQWAGGHYRFSSKHWWWPLLGDLFE